MSDHDRERRDSSRARTITLETKLAELLTTALGIDADHADDVATAIRELAEQVAESEVLRAR